MKLVVLGSPGVGKGTYTRLLAKRVDLPYISTGDMFRENVKKNTQLGKKSKSYMDKGQLVPDELVVKMLARRIKEPDCNNGFILDGFPRTMSQAKRLEEITRIDHVLRFIADSDVIIDRLSGRRVCRKCGETYHIRNIPPKKPGICDKCGGELYQRKDDRPEAIKKRLEVYKKQTAPLIEYYNEKIIEVDVNSPYEKRFQVLEKIEQVI